MEVGRSRQRHGKAFRLACAVLFAAALSLCGASVAYADTGTVTIMHTNDMHGYYAPDKKGTCIGLSPLKALVDNQQPDLLLDAGDTFHGLPFATVEQGTSIAQLMQAIGYDATTPGNHDWSYGADKLAAIDADYNFSILAANVLTTDGAPYFKNQYLVKDVTLDDGTTLKVGVLGVIDQSFYTSTLPENVAGVQFQDPVKWADKIAAQLKNSEGCDVVIALTHNRDPKGFAAQTTGIDAVIAGHEHVLMDESVTNAAGAQVPVVEAGYYLKNAGVLSLTVDYSKAADGSAENVTVSSHAETVLSPADATGLSDATVSDLISSIESDEKATLGEKIGTSSQAYPYSFEDLRTTDQPLGHVVTAAYLKQTGADIAFENAGGIRGGIPEGTVTAGDMLAISPYGNTLATYRMTGADVLSVVEHSLEISYQCNQVYDKQKDAAAAGEDPYQYSWPTNNGRVLVVGGITMTVDWSQKEGARVVSATVNGKALDPAATYTVAMNSYIPTLTDEYPPLATMQLDHEYGSCEQALRSFVAQDGWKSQVYPLSGTVTYGQKTPVNPEPSESTSTEDTTDEPVESDEPVADPSDTKGTVAKTLAKTDDPLTAPAAALLALCCLSGAAAVATRRRAGVSDSAER